MTDHPRSHHLQPYDWELRGNPRQVAQLLLANGTICAFSQNVDPELVRSMFLASLQTYTKRTRRAA